MSKSLSNGAQTVQLTLNTSDLVGYGHQVGKLVHPNSLFHRNSSAALAGVLFPVLALCNFVCGVSRRSNVRLRRLLLVVAISGLGLSVEACSGKLPRTTLPGDYTITVTAHDADPTSALAHTVEMHLQVIP
jgi:hypothetical protein